MAVQRYVFRYSPDKPLSGYVSAWERRQPRYSEKHSEWAMRDKEREARTYADFPYEKEGGGLTTELTEAKIIGWKSAKKWAAEEAYHGDLLPVTIALAPTEAGTDETLQAAQPEGREPGPKDAPND